MTRHGSAKTITMGAMCTALSVLCLYAAAVLPTGRLALYFLSSLFVYALSGEGAYLGAVCVYMASSALSLIMLPDRVSALPYIALLGHYGIFKAWIDSVMPDKIVRAAIKILYCDAFFVAAVLVAIKLFGISLTGIELPVPIPIGVVVLQLVFLAYDLLYWFCQRMYDERIRPAISPRR